MVNYNIKQINYLNEPNSVSSESILLSPITANSRIGQPETVTYNEYLLADETAKLSYCCEEKGMIYPIFIKTSLSTTYKQFYFQGGIFEVQPETFKDKNDIAPEEKDIVVYITGVKVPADIKFTIDYAI